MPNRAVIQTEQAPRAIGTYSQAIKVHNTVYLSGQIALLPDTMELISNNIDDQIRQVFTNLAAVCEAGGGGLNNLVKLNIFLTDLGHFATVNEIMASFFEQPYPARAAIGVKSLPKDAMVEMDGIIVV
ncbi:MAG: RidA family protein [Porticoccaceae bacterium]|nr:RidA family protein [Porticoccaceae bacterium]